MLLKKITGGGCVIQTFDEKGKFISQEFKVYDHGDVEFEDEDGNSLSLDDLPILEELYQPFDMVQDYSQKRDDRALLECREQICEDLDCRLDGIEDDCPGIIEDIQSIVVDNFARFGISIKKLMDDNTDKRISLTSED